MRAEARWKAGQTQPTVQHTGHQKIDGAGSPHWKRRREEKQGRECKKISRGARRCKEREPEWLESLSGKKCECLTWICCTVVTILLSDLLCVLCFVLCVFWCTCKVPMSLVVSLVYSRSRHVFLVSPGRHPCISRCREGLLCFVNSWEQHSSIARSPSHCCGVILAAVCSVNTHTKLNPYQHGVPLSAPFSPPVDEPSETFLKVWSSAHCRRYLL